MLYAWMLLGLPHLFAGQVGILEVSLLEIISGSCSSPLINILRSTPYLKLRGRKENDYRTSRSSQGALLPAFQLIA